MCGRLADPVPSCTAAIATPPARATETMWDWAPTKLCVPDTVGLSSKALDQAQPCVWDSSTV